MSQPNPHIQKFNVPFQPKFCASGRVANVHNTHVLPLTNDGLTVNDPNKLPETLPVNEVIDTFQTVNQEPLLSTPSKSVILIVKGVLPPDMVVVAVLVLPSASIMFTINEPHVPQVVKVFVLILVPLGAVFIE